MSAPAALPTERFVLGYAGFWWRVLAWMLDWVVLTLLDAGIARITGWRPFAPRYLLSFPGADGEDASVATVADLVVVHPGTMTAHWDVHGGALTLAGMVLALLYFTLFESSRWRATPGKKLCRLSVTDLSGRRIGPGRALVRCLAKVLSFVLFGIGFLMVGWTRRKQGLHDLIAGTLVLRRRPADTVFGFAPPA